MYLISKETDLGAAVLLIFGCWLLASALTATQRKLLTALIAREAFDVLMLLASWLIAFTERSSMSVFISFMVEEVRLLISKFFLFFKRRFPLIISKRDINRER